MKKHGFFAHLLLNAVTFLIISSLYSGIHVANFWTALAAAAVFGIVNVLLGSILRLLSLPLNFLTFGLFTFVINALLLLVTAKLYDGLQIQGFSAALIAALLFSLVNAVLSSIFGKKEKEKD